MWPPAVLEAVVVFVVVILIHKYYAPIFRHRWYVPLTVLPGFFFSVYILALVPTDVVSSEYNDCVAPTNATHHSCSRPLLYISHNGLTITWQILYWSTYVMCWTVYPLLQSYALAAGFTVFDRAFRAVVENVVFYGAIGLLLGLMLLIYGLARGLSWVGIEAMAIAGSNVWGFILVMVFFGYGLVAIPRLTWRYANHKSWYRYMCFEAITYRDDMRVAKGELLQNMKIVKRLDDAWASTYPLRAELDRVIGSCPAAYEELPAADRAPVDDMEYDRGALVKLKTKIKTNRNAYTRNLWMYERCLNRAFAKMDIFEASTSPERFVIPWKFASPRKHKYMWTQVIFNATEYVWELYLRTWFYRFLAVLCAVLSVTLLWSECMLFTNQLDDMPDLSLWPRIIAFLPQTGGGAFLKPWVIVLPLTYMTVCTYWGLFRFRLFEYYRLVPHHSNPGSLLFAALYLCRLIAPLVYNFLAVMGTTDTAFYTFMGRMDRVPLVGGINRYLPIALVFVVLATLFEVFTRVSTWLTWLNIRRFNFSSSWTHAQLEEGELLVRRKRESRERKLRLESVLPKGEPVGGSASYAQSVKGRRRANSVQHLPILELPEEGSRAVPRDGADGVRRIGNRTKSMMKPRSSSHAELPPSGVATSGAEFDLEMHAVPMRRTQSYEKVVSKWMNPMDE